MWPLCRPRARPITGRTVIAAVPGISRQPRATSSSIRPIRLARTRDQPRRSRAYVVIVGEDVTRRLDFRHDVNNTLCTIECRKNGPFEEIGGNVDAAESNAIIERRRRCQALQAMVLRSAFYNPVQRDVVLVIHPDKVWLARFATQIGDEAASRGCAVSGRYG